MNYKLYVAFAITSLLLSSCSNFGEKLISGPELSSVDDANGTNLRTGSISQTYTPQEVESKQWIGGPGDFFRDSIARRKGDLITVHIAINDQANFKTSSDRSRKAGANGSATFNLGFFGLGAAGTGTGNAAEDSSSSGQGTVARSEKLNVSMAAVVREVLPNGNMIIEGSQQVLVNYERRDVRVTGIIDPRNIAQDNSIDYSKIAEARVFYGGVGKSNDSLKPRWGMQLWDKISPF